MAVTLSPICSRQCPLLSCDPCNLLLFHVGPTQGCCPGNTRRDEVPSGDAGAYLASADAVSGRGMLSSSWAVNPVQRRQHARHGLPNSSRRRSRVRGRLQCCCMRAQLGLIHRQSVRAPLGWRGWEGVCDHTYQDMHWRKGEGHRRRDVLRLRQWSCQVCGAQFDARFWLCRACRIYYFQHTP